jgi:hypothetical protein
MSVHHGKYADRRARTPLDQDRKPAARTISNDLRPKAVRWLGFAPPSVDDQDNLTILLLMTIMVLSALNFMLRFPDLGAVIAQYNQF